MNCAKRFLKNDCGQDVVEYTLLLAFVALTSAAMFINAGGSVKGIWTVTNTLLSNANSASS